MDFNNNNQSSRINLDGYNSKPFNLFENLNVSNNKFDKLTGNNQSSTLSDLYFSQANIDYVQAEIISRVYDKTQRQNQIGKQSEDELLIVMRSTYLQHGKNIETHLDEQVDKLNELVLGYCVDNVYTNLIQYLSYIDDITKDQPVLDRPQSFNVKGDRSLQPKHFF
jgi:hypothetical protein